MSTVLEPVTDCVLKISDRELWYRLQSPGPTAGVSWHFHLGLDQCWAPLALDTRSGRCDRIHWVSLSEQKILQILLVVKCGMWISDLCLFAFTTLKLNLSSPCRLCEWWDDHRLSLLCSKTSNLNGNNLPNYRQLTNDMWMRGNKKSVGVLHTEDSFPRNTIPNAQGSGFDENNT